MILDYKGVGVLGLLAIGVLWYASRKVGAAAESVVDGFIKFGDGLTFDPASLGEPVTLTEPAQLSQQDYIDRGYLIVLPDGGTQITAAGNQYIENQQRVNQ